MRALNLGNSCHNWLLAKCLDNKIADWNSGKGNCLKEQDYFVIFDNLAKFTLRDNLLFEMEFSTGNFIGFCRNL